MKGIRKAALVVCLTVLCTLGVWGQTGHLATLKGMVVDTNDARVPNALIVLTNDVRNYKIKTNEYGEYELTSEPGKYKVSVDASSLGFGVTRRSELWLAPHSTYTLKIKVYSKNAVQGHYLSQGEDEVMDHGAVHGSHGYQDLPGLSTVGVSSGMIRYATKCESGDVITFGSSGDGVTFTYDFFTVTADTMRMLKNENEIYALGNLIIETEKRTEKFKGKMLIRIEKGKAITKKIG